MSTVQIKSLFTRSIHRSINGVIKADQDDAESVWQELDEYVITRELDQHLRSFFESYLAALDNPQDASGRVGVWISGFFGSGKSHFLKILSYLLENKQVSKEGETRQAIDFFERILGKYLIPRMDIERAIARTREDNYGTFRDRSRVGGYSLLKDIPDIEIAAVKVGEKSVFTGKTIAQTALRKTCGVTMVAIKHGETVIPNPEPSTVINGNDIAYLLGKPEMIAIASNILSESLPD